MFEHLKEFPRIIVTGPQRAGTRIATKMIAADTGHAYIDELDIGVCDVDRLTAALDTDSHAGSHSGRLAVIQCPDLCLWIIRHLAQTDTLVCLMRRSLADIHASEERIDWASMTGEAIVDNPYRATAEEKYAAWNAGRIAGFPFAALEIEYESLSGHPLWIPPEGRVGFHPLQTTRGS